MSIERLSIAVRFAVVSLSSTQGQKFDVNIRNDTFSQYSTMNTDVGSNNSEQELYCSIEIFLAVGPISVGEDVGVERFDITLPHPKLEFQLHFFQPQIKLGGQESGLQEFLIYARNHRRTTCGLWFKFMRTDKKALIDWLVRHRGGLFCSSISMITLGRIYSNSCLQLLGRCDNGCGVAIRITSLRLPRQVMFLPTMSPSSSILVCNTRLSKGPMTNHAIQNGRSHKVVLFLHFS